MSFHTLYFPGLSLAGFLLLALWTIIWQGFALWHSARAGQRNWFLANLILNTLGIIPIIYLIWFRPKGKLSPKKKGKSREGKMQ